jgi:hypothetical protein
MSDISSLMVAAAVRYWEDATVNGVEDTNGTLIPFRRFDLWKPTICLQFGTIRNWPPGTTADIHYKVCDAGKYWLSDECDRKLYKWAGDYVPDDLLCQDGSGYGDYIIMKVGADGRIQDWKLKPIDLSDWTLIPESAAYVTH